MFIVENYSLAIIFCIVTMFCWGSGEIPKNLQEKPGDMNCFIGIM